MTYLFMYVFIYYLFTVNITTP